MNELKQVSVEIQAMANEYLRDTLSAEKKAEFEEMLLNNPQWVESLELDQVFIDTLPKVKSKEAKTSLFEMLFGRPLSASLTTACACFLVSLITWQMKAPVPYSSEINFNNQLVYLETTRSNNDATQTISLASGRSHLVLVLQPATLEETLFTVTVHQAQRDRNHKRIAHIQQANISDDGELVVSMPTRTLESGDYLIELSGNTTHFQQSFTFNITN